MKREEKSCNLYVIIKGVTMIDLISCIRIIETLRNDRFLKFLKIYLNIVVIVIAIIDVSSLLLLKLESMWFLMIVHMYKFILINELCKVNKQIESRWRV